MTAIKKIDFFYNGAADGARELCEKLAEKAVASGASVGVITTDAREISADLTVALGGDGTMLKAAAGLRPILGVNMGRLGFLTDTDADGAEAALRKVLAGEFVTERRGAINVAARGKAVTALNDTVIRSLPAKAESFAVYVNGAFAMEWRGDGVIVSTATGSAAYNFSAGGPLLTPDCAAFAVTPVCPHSFRARSLVVADSAEIVVELSGGAAVTEADGAKIAELKDGDRVKVVKAKDEIILLKTSGLDFYEILRQKL